MEKYTLVIFVLFFASCGKRTTTTNKTDVKTDSIIISKNYFLEQNIKLNDIGSIHPFDALKPIVIDGKYYYNAIINFDKSIAYNGVEKNISNLSYTGLSEKEKSKATEKSDPAIMYIGIAFVICLFIFLWVYLPKLSIPKLT